MAQDTDQTINNRNMTTNIKTNMSTQYLTSGPTPENNVSIMNSMNGDINFKNVAASFSQIGGVGESAGAAGSGDQSNMMNKANMKVISFDVADELFD